MVKVSVVFKLLAVFDFLASIHGFQVPTFWFTGVRGNLPREDIYLLINTNYRDTVCKNVNVQC